MQTLCSKMQLGGLANQHCEIEGFGRAWILTNPPWLSLQPRPGFWTDSQEAARTLPSHRKDHVSSRAHLSLTEMTRWPRAPAVASPREDAWVAKAVAGFLSLGDGLEDGACAEEIPFSKPDHLALASGSSGAVRRLIILRRTGHIVVDRPS